MSSKRTTRETPQDEADKDGVRRAVSAVMQRLREVRRTAQARRLAGGEAANDDAYAQPRKRKRQAAQTMSNRQRRQSARGCREVR